MHETFPWWSGVVVEEFALPGQMGGIGGRNLWQRKVICAMIEQAVSDCRSSTDDNEWEDAARWITGEDGSSVSEPWDFDSLCSVVSTDADAVKDVLRRDGFLPRSGGRIDREGIKRVKRRRRTRVR